MPTPNQSPNSKPTFTRADKIISAGALVGAMTASLMGGNSIKPPISQEEAMQSPAINTDQVEVVPTDGYVPGSAEKAVAAQVSSNGLISSPDGDTSLNPQYDPSHPVSPGTNAGVKDS